MNRHVQKGLRVLVTLLIVAAAGYGAWWLWVRYNRDPWTRDGRLRAELTLKNSGRGLNGPRADFQATRFARRRQGFAQ